MLKLGSKLSLPSVSLTGFETPLAEEERAIQSAAHQFARDVLRPLGRELDKLTAEQVVAPGSPYYTLFAEAATLGTVSYTHLTLPTSDLVKTSVVAVSLKKK